MIARALAVLRALRSGVRWSCLAGEHRPAWLEPVEDGPRCLHCRKLLSEERGDADRNLPVRRRRVLTVHQRYALAICKQTGQPGVVTSGPTAILDGQPWINYRTAYSLHDRGLVRVHPYGEADAMVILP